MSSSNVTISPQSLNILLPFFFSRLEFDLFPMTLLLNKVFLALFNMSNVIFLYSGMYQFFKNNIICCKFVLFLNKQSHLYVICICIFFLKNSSPCFISSRLYKTGFIFFSCSFLYWQRCKYICRFSSSPHLYSTCIQGLRHPSPVNALTKVHPSNEYKEIIRLSSLVEKAEKGIFSTLRGKQD